MTKRNKPTDIFKHLDMSGGPEWTNPETGEVSRCWPFTGGLNDQGRPWFSVNGKKVLAYRLVWDLVKEDKLGDRKYLHQCDNPVCCNPAHGKPGTHEENMNEMKTRERHGLSHHMVKAIRTMAKQGMAQATIVEMTGIAQSTISDIITRKNYDHVKDE